jgi:hypothetical protein
MSFDTCSRFLISVLLFDMSFNTCFLSLFQHNTDDTIYLIHDYLHFHLDRLVAKENHGRTGFNNSNAHSESEQGLQTSCARDNLLAHSSLVLMLLS